MSFSIWNTLASLKSLFLTSSTVWYRPNYLPLCPLCICLSSALAKPLLTPSTSTAASEHSLDCCSVVLHTAQKPSAWVVHQQRIVSNQTANSFTCKADHWNLQVQFNDRHDNALRKRPEKCKTPAFSFCAFFASSKPELWSFFLFQSVATCSSASSASRAPTQCLAGLLYCRQKIQKTSTQMERTISPNWKPLFHSSLSSELLGTTFAPTSKIMDWLFFLR